MAHVCGVCGAGSPVGVGMVDDPMVDRMKKIPKSITVTIEKEGNQMLCPSMDTPCVETTWFRLLRPPLCKSYRVTYTVNPRGPFRVVKSDEFEWPFLKKAKGRDDNKDRFVCFLKPFIGLRVSRKVEKIK